MEAARPQGGARVDHRSQDDIELRDVIAGNLRNFERAESRSPQKLAAVAITLVLDQEGEPAVPIFQRKTTMRRHAGQMAIPGGRTHHGEDAVGAAIRELDEELGLLVDRADVLGMLDDFDTVSGFTITPVVVWSGAEASAMKPSDEEVEQLFVVPVSMLRAAARDAGKGSSFSLNFPLVEVFAPTAAMLFQFSEVALDGRSVRVADFFQPPWTHR